jgi:hypothetical protein
MPGRAHFVNAAAEAEFNELMEQLADDLADED